MLIVSPLLVSFGVDAAPASRPPIELEAPLQSGSISLLITIMVFAQAQPARFVRPGDLVYRMVKRRIVLNELRPGRIVTELGLANELGCSQGTVREALL